MKHGRPRAPWLAQPRQREGSAQLPGIVQCSSAPAGSFPQWPPRAARRLPHRCFRQHCCSPRGRGPEHAKPRALPPARTPSAVEAPGHGHSVPQGGCPSPKTLMIIAQGNVPGQIWPEIVNVKIFLIRNTLPTRSDFQEWPAPRGDAKLLETLKCQNRINLKVICVLICVLGSGKITIRA